MTLWGKGSNRVPYGQHWASRDEKGSSPPHNKPPCRDKTAALLIGFGVSAVALGHAVVQSFF